jgi:hypothetical protein
MEKISLKNINVLKKENSLESQYLHLFLFYEYFLQETESIFGFKLSFSQIRKLFFKSSLDFGSVESVALVLSRIKSGEKVERIELEESKADLESFLLDLKSLKKNRIFWQKKKIVAWILFGKGKFLLSTTLFTLILILFVIPFLAHFTTGKSIVENLVSLSDLIWRWIFILLLSAAAIVISVTLIIFILEKRTRRNA